MPGWAPLLIGRLHSLLGVVPLGILAVVFAVPLAGLGGGRQAMSGWIKLTDSVPWLIAEVSLVYLPLLVHAAYGLRLAISKSYNLTRYSAANNWSYSLQRVTGPVILFWAATHIWLFRIPVMSGELRPEDSLDFVFAQLSATSTSGVPLMLIGYLGGVTALSIHLGTGVERFAFTWGLISAKRERLLRQSCIALSVLLWLFLSHVTLLAGTGTGLLGGLIVG